jgi:hypothetical protein
VSPASKVGSGSGRKVERAGGGDFERRRLVVLRSGYLIEPRLGLRTVDVVKTPHEQGRDHELPSSDWPEHGDLDRCDTSCGGTEFEGLDVLAEAIPDVLQSGQPLVPLVQAVVQSLAIALDVGRLLLRGCAHHPVGTLALVLGVDLDAAVVVLGLVRADVQVRA